MNIVLVLGDVHSLAGSSGVGSSAPNAVDSRAPRNTIPQVDHCVYIVVCVLVFILYDISRLGFVLPPTHPRLILRVPVIGGVEPMPRAMAGALCGVTTAVEVLTTEVALMRATFAFRAAARVWR